MGLERRIVLSLIKQHAATRWQEDRAQGLELPPELAWKNNLHVPTVAMWAFAARALDERETVVVQEHINGCRDCRAAVDRAVYVQANILRPGGAPSIGVARALLGVVLRVLPRAERSRRFEEFYAEMSELRPRQQIGYALSMLVGIVSLRRAIAENAADAAGRRANT